MRSSMLWLRPGAWDCANLQRKLGFPPSTVHRLLAILTASRYLTQDPDTKKYRLSLKFLELGCGGREDLDVITVARPHMTALMEATSETVNLALFDGAGIVYVDQVANSNSFLRMFTRVGTRAPLHCTGVGKACLAGLPEEFVVAILALDREETLHRQDDHR